MIIDNVDDDDDDDDGDNDDDDHDGDDGDHDVHNGFEFLPPSARPRPQFKSDPSSSAPDLVDRVQFSIFNFQFYPSSSVPHQVDQVQFSIHNFGSNVFSFSR